MLINTAKIKMFLIYLFGQQIAGFLHGFRFFLILRFATKEIDPEVSILRNILSEGDIAIDVGANGANWTYYLANAVGKSGHVYAFEADPYYALATKWAINFLNLRSVTLFPFALSNENKDLHLNIYSKNGTRLSGLSSINKKEDKNSVPVKSRSIDTMLLNYPDLINCRLFKCDTEGFELFVFKGAEKIIDKSRPIIIYEVGRFEKYNYTKNQLFNFFIQKKYLSFTMLKNGFIAKTNKNLEHKKAASVNRLMIPYELLYLFKDKISFSK
ncbi:MAG: hypothetical protein RLZ10_1919 [Bacteroidota bacterium]|jgi:FkbM family methyltransferase